MAAQPLRSTRAELTDPELLSLVNDGDVSALGVLYDRYEQDIRRVLVRLGVPLSDVEDLVQETFLEIPRCARNYDGRRNARPWLIGLSVNQARRYKHSLRVVWRNLTAWAREPGAPLPTPEELTERAIAADLARRALARLSIKKREVFTLVVLEGLPGEEVAAMLGIPTATVWTRLHHARRELRAAISSEAP